MNPKPASLSITKTIRHDPSSLAHNSVVSIFEDQQGNFWVGTQGGGLNLLDRQTGQFTRYQNNPLDASSLCNKSIVSIFEDRSGILWLGTFGTGADFYDPSKNKFLLLRSEPGNPQSLSNSSIWSIYQDPQGILWIGTNGGGFLRASSGLASSRWPREQDAGGLVGAEVSKTHMARHRSRPRTSAIQR